MVIQVNSQEFIAYANGNLHDGEILWKQGNPWSEKLKSQRKVVFSTVVCSFSIVLSEHLFLAVLHMVKPFKDSNTAN